MYGENGGRIKYLRDISVSLMSILKGCAYRDLCMRTLSVLLCCLLPVFQAAGQVLYGFAGAGVGYDAFLRDKTVTRYKNPWPLELGIQTVAGLRFQTGQSFDAMLDVSAGSVRVRYPVPEKVESRTTYDMVQFLAMAGSGVHITADEQNDVMPFVQIGAGYFDYSGYSTSGKGFDDHVQVSRSYDRNTGRWLPVIGGGIDWQFRLYVPACFNLRFVYTPLSFFDMPEPYTFSTGSRTENLLLQGKMLQTIFTFRVFLRMAKWEKRYS